MNISLANKIQEMKPLKQLRMDDTSCPDFGWNSADNSTGAHWKCNSVWGLCHKAHIYLEYHSVCPLVPIGTPHPLYRKRVFSSPRTQSETRHTRLLVRGWGVPIRTTGEKAQNSVYSVDCALRVCHFKWGKIVSSSTFYKIIQLFNYRPIYNLHMIFLLSGRKFLSRVANITRKVATLNYFTLHKWRMKIVLQKNMHFPIKTFVTWHKT
jgi:hypothetical protein